MVQLPADGRAACACAYCLLLLALALRAERERGGGARPGVPGPESVSHAWPFILISDAAY
jgi:hypothetical protein